MGFVNFLPVLRSSLLCFCWFLWVLFSHMVHSLCDGVTCGVEACLSSIGTKVSCVFSFPFGLFLHVVTALRDMVTIWVRCVGRFTLLRGRHLSLVLRPFSFWLGFEPLSEASLSALSLRECFLVVLAEDESLRLSLSSLQCSSRPHVMVTCRLHATCSQTTVVIGALP